jgi:hypothetical protein
MACSGKAKRLLINNGLWLVKGKKLGFGVMRRSRWAGNGAGRFAPRNRLATAEVSLERRRVAGVECSDLTGSRKTWQSGQTSVVTFALEYL